MTDRLLRQRECRCECHGVPPGPCDLCAELECWAVADCPIPAAGEVAKPCSACATTMCDPCHECGGSGYESAVNT